MTKSIEVLTQLFLEDADDFVAIIPAARISAMSVDRNYDLADGAVAIYREVTNAPQNSLDGWSGLTLHSYAVTILSYDPDEASRAATALKSRFRSPAVWPFKPTGWANGEAYLEAGEIRDGSTEDTPEIVSDHIIVQKTVVLDLWFQE